MADAKRSNELSVSLNASVLLAAGIMEYERNPERMAIYPQKSLLAVITAARYSHPILAAHIGITSEVKPGVFSSEFEKIHEVNGKANELIDNVPGLQDHAPLVRQVMKEQIVLGAIGYQAIRYAQSDISLLKAELAPSKKFVKTRKNKGVSAALQNLTGEDLEILGAGDMENVFQSALNRVLIDGIQKDTKPSSLFMRTKAALAAIDGDCHYLVAQGTKSIICGGVEWRVGSAPNMTVGGNPWISPGSFGGMDATYRISGSWSYSEMMDKADSISNSSKVSNDKSAKIDDSITRGRGRDFVMNAKTAADRALKASGSTNVGNK